ncbi:MAG TPA: hypothetical protein VM925_10470 [Labilithrix sp.]|nr:hypothetical protein [Labilithrix sp.]
MTSPRPSLPWHGGAALACWAIHGGTHDLHGRAHDLLWACNVAVPLLALGCFLGQRLACAIALSWLAFGTPIWLVDLATGKGMIPTSVLVHLVAPVIAVFAVMRLGWPPRGWVSATLASVVLLLVTRLVGSEATNVNLAFRVHDGWERHFDSYPAFVGLLFAASAAVFFAIDALVSRFVGARPLR